MIRTLPEGSAPDVLVHYEWAENRMNQSAAGNQCSANQNHSGQERANQNHSVQERANQWIDFGVVSVVIGVVVIGILSVLFRR